LILGLFSLYQLLLGSSRHFSFDRAPMSGPPLHRRRARARKAIKPYLVLDGGMDCEKTGGPTKQVE
jgi:hypothetical protein